VSREKHAPHASVILHMSKRNQIIFEWIEPLTWAKWQLESATVCSVPTTGDPSQFQHKVTITSNDITFTAAENTRIIPIRNIDYIRIDKEFKNDEIISLIHITDQEPTTVSFALDESIRPDALLRWFEDHGIATEDSRENNFGDI